MITPILVCALLSGPGLAGAEPALALPPGMDGPAWEAALQLANLAPAESGALADLRCRQVAGIWELVIGEGRVERVLARVPAPSNQREREDLALLAASLLMELGRWTGGSERQVEERSELSADPVTPGATPVVLASLQTEEAARRAVSAEEAAQEEDVTAVLALSAWHGVGDDSGFVIPQPPEAAAKASPPEGEVVGDATAESPVDEVSAAPSEPVESTPLSLPAPREARLPAWLSLGMGLQLQQGLEPGGRVQGGLGLLLRESWWLGLRTGLTSPRSLAALDHAQWVSEWRLGGLLRWAPARRRLGPMLGVALDNGWRRYSLGTDPPARHTVLVVSAEAGLGIHGERWSLLTALRLHEDLDRTVLRQGQVEETELSRLQGEVGLTLVWRVGGG